MSVVMALLFGLVWVSVYQQFQPVRDLISAAVEPVGVIDILVPVFLTSFLFFLFNFYYGYRHPTGSSWLPDWKQLLYNLLMVIGLTFALREIAASMLEDPSKGPLFALILVRNFILSLVALLLAKAYAISEKSKQDELKLLAANNEKMQAEMGALKAQVDPHFLFNSLNSLTGVIRQDQKEAIKFVNHLSQTMRYTLDNRETQLVTLQEELGYLQSYEYMMQIRFGDGFVVLKALDELAMGRKLPQFALQLLVENAIKHNRVSVKSPLEIRISLDEDRLTVTNNLQPKASVPKGYGFGLANLSKRYELLDMPALVIEKTETEFSVTLSLK